MPAHLIVLAAGRGSRMKSDRPKVLHPLGGAPLFTHVLRSADGLATGRKILVAGHGGAAVRAAAAAHDPEIEVVEQAEQRGTAHAVQQARASVEGCEGDVLVLYGDTPFVTGDTLAAMIAARREGAAVVVLGFEAADPGRYGRLVMRDGRLERIVEWKDATEAERAITLCNSGVICADAGRIFDLLDAVGCDNAAGEYYLTDIVGIARARGLEVGAVSCPEAETLGINTRAELARAEALFQERARARALDAGVTMIAPETVYFSHDTRIGRDTVIEPHVVFGPGVDIDAGATIRAFSHLEGCTLGRGAIVGPHARLRPGARIGEDARIGNFVEIKGAEIGAGAKVNHLSYVGDARVGPAANLGAGTITCNYDGVFKHRTEIGADAFVGSSTILVAPVTVGARAMTAAGSVVTLDVPEGALALARARQVNKDGLAARMMARLRAAKAKRTN